MLSLFEMIILTLPTLEKAMTSIIKKVVKCRAGAFYAFCGLFLDFSAFFGIRFVARTDREPSIFSFFLCFLFFLFLVSLGGDYLPSGPPMVCSKILY